MYNKWNPTIFFIVWFILLSIMFSRFIPVVVFVRIPSFEKAE